MFDVQRYAQHALQQRANGYKMYVENHALIAGIPVGGRVLDIGCGPGTVTRLLTYSTNLGEIVGIDADPRMIEEAKKRNHSSRMTFHAWDIQKPLESCGKFDLVTSNAMMHWIPDQHAALGNIYDCLKPGGHFLAHFMARARGGQGQGPMHDEEKWKPFLNEGRGNHHAQNAWQSAENPAEFYRKMLEDNHKFKIIKCENRTMINYYNETELEAHCETMAGNRLKPEIPEEKRKEFINEVKERTKSRWECIKTETGNFYVHKTERIILLVQKPN